MTSDVSPDGVKVLSVSDLTQEIKGLLEDGFPCVWVAGEVSNLAKPASGHLYLTLKDDQSQLRAVMWRGVALRLRFDLRDGQQVIVRGRVSVYPPRGEYQLVVEELQPKGIGALELALRQLKEKLFRLGYFDPQRKRSLPRFPLRLALVTSPSGAAIRDMLETLRKRWPAVEVWVCPVRVQGAGAGEEIAAAIRLLNQLNDHTPVDVMIVGRGGGSVEDLWAFNEEVVARAIYQSAIPVVSAVGHEIDWTIADGVADCRALTPTDAATRVVPDRREVLQLLGDSEQRLGECLLGRLEMARRGLDELARRPPFRLPLERIQDLERRLDEWGGRLERAARQRLDAATQRLQSQAARLETLSPLNVLARGYSLTRKLSDQTVVRDSNQVQPGNLLETLVQRGRIISRVEEPPPPALLGSIKDDSLSRGCAHE
jgi:exodeoxyribonuclease VII large subunit